MVSVGVLAMVFALFMARASKNASRARKPRGRAELAKHPRTSIAAASEGLLRVTGRVCRRGEPLRDPLNDQPCVAFQLLVWGRDAFTGWVPLLDVREGQTFVVADEGGEALVDLSGPYDLFLKLDRRGSNRLLRNSITPAQLKALRELVDRPTLEAKHWLGYWSTLRYRVGVLGEGDEVSALGYAARETSAVGARPNLRTPPLRLVLRGTDERPLLIGK
jgi:hypothetical protein